MKFWASSEAYGAASERSEEIRRVIEPLLSKGIDESSLTSVDVEIRYVPIIMPDDLLSKYPDRSRLRRRTRIYECAPQLSYEIFSKGSPTSQLSAYIEGIRSAAPWLKEFDADEGQIAEFVYILDATHTSAAEQMGLHDTNQPVHVVRRPTKP